MKVRKTQWVPILFRTWGGSCIFDRYVEMSFKFALQFFPGHDIGNRSQFKFILRWSKSSNLQDTPPLLFKLFSWTWFFPDPVVDNSALLLVSWCSATEPPPPSSGDCHKSDANLIKKISCHSIYYFSINTVPEQVDFENFSSWWFEETGVVHEHFGVIRERRTILFRLREIWISGSLFLSPH